MNPQKLLAAATLSADQPGARATSKLFSDSSRMAAMEAAFDTQIKRNTKGKMGSQDVIVEEPYIKQVSSREEAFNDIMANGPDDYASNGIKGNRNQVFINPNLDESAFFHELGHIASRQGRLGSFVRTMRDNPQLTKALGQAAMIAPLGAAALIPGDDDMAASVALSLAAASPTLIDEAMASQNALNMMKNTGNRATMGQRGRLAGAYATYLAAPMLSAVSGNFFGNLADDELTSLLGYN